MAESFNPYEQRIIGLKEQQALARRLREGAEQAPQGQMVGNVYVAPHWTQQLARGLNYYAGMQGEKQARQGIDDINTQRTEERNAWLESMPKSTTMQGPEGPMQDGSPQTVTKNPSTEDYLTWASKGATIDPVVANMGMTYANLSASREQRQAELEARLADAKSSRQEKIEAQRQLMQMQFDNQRSLAAMNNAARMDVARLAHAMRQQPEGKKEPDWKYDAGSDTWVKPPNEQYPMGQSTPNVGKASSLKNIEYLTSRFLGSDQKPGVISYANQGGWMGLGGTIGRVSNSQAAKEFDNLTEQMSTEMRKIFRIPGEGALSDKEQAQYGIQLPKLGNDPGLNRKIIEDLLERSRNSVMPNTNPLQPQPTKNVTVNY